MQINHSIMCFHFLMDLNPLSPFSVSFSFTPMRVCHVRLEDISEVVTNLYESPFCLYVEILSVGHTN